MRKIVTIVGARPQFIKAAPVSSALRQRGLEEVIVHTGQHFDDNMSDIFFRQMGIPQPDYHLGIHGLSHSAMTGQMMVAIEKVLEEVKPDLVLVYGDTNSTLAGAVTAKKLDMGLAHVEACLRSFNRRMPEEINRIVTDHLSDYLFCPTQGAVNQAYVEGLQERTYVGLTGDVMYDALLRFRKLSVLPEDVPVSGFILCTLHRQENTDNPERFGELVEGLNRIAGEMPVVFPVHPRSRTLLDKHSLNKGIRLIEPVGYLEMLALLEHCELVITDSGGLQKEAYFFRKYCLTMRDETEWVELVENGYNQLVGADQGLMHEAAIGWIGQKISNPKPLYGLGNASDIIAGILAGDVQGDDEPVRGILPDRDLKKNLGCG